MAEETTNKNEQPLAVIPPGLLPIIAVIGIVVALVVGLTQSEFNVIGWGSLGLAGLAIIAWALMSPEQVREILSGRSMRFGGVAVLVTLVFIIALVAIYVIIRSQNIRLDLSQTDTFSLRDEVRERVATIASDPTIPDIRIISFYNVQQAGQRDRNEVLLTDFQEASNGKITYEFIDPDRDPLLAQGYEAASGDTIVTVIGEDGKPDQENAEAISFFSQEEIINAIMRATARGDFRAYFITVQDGLSIEETGGTGLSQVNDLLVDNLHWTTQQSTLLELVDEEGNSILNDPEADGEVMIIAGGSSALPDDQLQIVTDYIAAGGDVILFSTLPSEVGEPALLTAPNMSDYLWQTFGVRVLPDVVIDPPNSISSDSVFSIGVNELNASSPIGSTVLGSGTSTLLYSFAYSIQVRDTLPEGVQVTSIANTSIRSYSKPIDDLTALGRQLTLDDVRQDDDDPVGPFDVGITIHNTETDAHIVIMTSDLIPQNRSIELQSAGIGNFYATFGSFIWATTYDQFFVNIDSITPVQQPQDAPLFASDQDLRNANFVTVILLPFGILFLGVFIWWNGRARATSK